MTAQSVSAERVSGDASSAIAFAREALDRALEAASVAGAEDLTLRVRAALRELAQGTGV